MRMVNLPNSQLWLTSLINAHSAMDDGTNRLAADDSVVLPKQCDNVDMNAAATKTPFDANVREPAKMTAVIDKNAVIRRAWTIFNRVVWYSLNWKTLTITLASFFWRLGGEGTKKRCWSTVVGGRKSCLLEQIQRDFPNIDTPGYYPPGCLHSGGHQKYIGVALCNFALRQWVDPRCDKSSFDV